MPYWGSDICSLDSFSTISLIWGSVLGQFLGAKKASGKLFPRRGERVRSLPELGSTLGSVGGHVLSVTPPTLFVFVVLYVFTKGCESIPSIDFGITNIFQQVHEFTHTEFMTNKVDFMCIFAAFFAYLHSLNFCGATLKLVPASGHSLPFLG